VALTRVLEIRLEVQGWTPWWVEMNWEVGFVDPVSEWKHKPTDIEMVVVIEMSKHRNGTSKDEYSAAFEGVSSTHRNHWTISFRH